MITKLKIALDYDHTYSADPEFWKGFMELAALAGHEVKIVTVRNRKFDRTAPLMDLENEAHVIYTSGVAKKWYLTHFGDGFVPDIWIDDKPESILENSSASPEVLQIWREERNEPEGRGVAGAAKRIHEDRVESSKALTAQIDQIIGTQTLGQLQGV